MKNKKKVLGRNGGLNLQLICYTDTVFVIMPKAACHKKLNAHGKQHFYGRTKLL